VKELAEEFDINEVSKIEKTTLSNLGKISPEEGMPIESEGMVTEVFPDLKKTIAMEEVVEAEDEENEDFEDMEDDEEEDKQKLVII
jgi:hypothetical protein